MLYKGIDKFEYKFENFWSSIDKTIQRLNILGQEGWEIIELIKPKTIGEQYKGFLKRKITEVEV